MEKMDLADVTQTLECVGDACQLSTEPQRPRKGKPACRDDEANRVRRLHSQQDLNTVISSHDSVIVEFMTSWCKACESIAPLYGVLAEQAQDGSSFQAAQVFCDKNKETKKLAKEYGVGSYPVFVVFDHGRETQRWIGADRGKLEKAFERFSGGGGRKGKGKNKGRK